MDRTANAGTTFKVVRGFKSHPLRNVRQPGGH